MKDEYIIINRTVLEKRIEELEKNYIQESEEDMKIWLGSQIGALKEILSQSTPLIPEIEKAWESGEKYGLCDWADFMGEPAPINKQEYISNVKLDI